MGTKGDATKENILEIAQTLMLQKGFAGTSLEEIIAGANITKGGFFYHFNNKDELARQLLLKYQRDDKKFFQGLFDRAIELSEDPLQQVLIFLKLLSESMDNLPDVHPGCLVATFTSSDQMMDQSVKDVTADCLISWRKMFKQHFELIESKYKKRTETNTDDLADMLSTIIEGGIIVSRGLSDQKILVNQLLLFRDYVRLSYSDVTF